MPKFREEKRERYRSLAELRRLGGTLAQTETSDLASVFVLAAFRLLMLTGCRLLDELHAQGITTLREIAEALNDRGMLTRRGGRWHVSNVRNAIGAGNVSSRRCSLAAGASI